MPFPFAALGTLIASGVGSAVAGGAAAAAAAGAAVAGAATVAGTAVAAAGTTSLVIGGVTIAAGSALTAAAISSRNAEKRRQAREAAERLASRERERIFLQEKKELDTELKNLQEKYGEAIPPEIAQELCAKSAELLGNLEGNSAGLRKKGKRVAAEAEAAQAELRAMFEEGGWGAAADSGHPTPDKDAVSAALAGVPEQVAPCALTPNKEDVATPRQRMGWFGEEVSSHRVFGSAREHEAWLVERRREMMRKMKALCEQYGVAEIPKE